jgi:hypothetical protein
MLSLSTDADCNNPSLHPSPPGGIENEEVVMLDVVSPATTAENSYMPTVNACKSAAAK